MYDLDQIRHSVEMEERIADLSRPEQGYQYQPVSVIKGWNPFTDQATDTIDLQDGTWNLPEGIKAVSVWMSYKAANNNDYAYLEKELNDGAAVYCICPDANEYATGSGIVTCDSNGDIYFKTNNGTNTVYLYVHGYFK